VEKVIKAFRERYQNMRLYQPGDEYTYKNPERINYLVQLGFLSVESEPQQQKSQEESKPKRRKKGVNDDGDPYG